MYFPPGSAWLQPRKKADALKNKNLPGNDYLPSTFNLQPSTHIWERVAPAAQKGALNDPVFI
jgi:hypothetical protein